MERLLEDYFEDNIVAKEWNNDYEDVIEKLIDVQYSCSDKKINTFLVALEKFETFSYNILEKDCFFDVFMYYVDNVITVLDSSIENLEYKFDFGDCTTSYLQIESILKELNNIKEEYLKRPLKQPL